MPPRRSLFALSAAAALTLFAGLAVTSLLFVAVSALEYDKMELSFQQRAAVRAAVIRRGMDDAVEVVTTTNALFKSFDTVSRAQFHDFTQPLLARYPFIQAFNYHRVLNEADRPAYEAQMRRLLPGYTMNEMRDGVLIPVRPRPQHIVIDYLEPMRGNERDFGMDVSPNLPMHSAIERAIDSGLPTATPLLRLAQETGSQRGFVLLQALYRRGAPVATPEQRRAAWTGDSGAVIRSADLIQKILQAADLLNDATLRLEVYIGDPARPSNRVYSAGPEGPPAAGEARQQQRQQHWMAMHYHDRATF